jgi:hypothetical protein
MPAPVSAGGQLPHRSALPLVTLSPAEPGAERRTRQSQNTAQGWPRIVHHSRSPTCYAAPTPQRLPRFTHVAAALWHLDLPLRADQSVGRRRCRSALGEFCTFATFASISRFRKNAKVAPKTRVINVKRLGNYRAKCARPRGNCADFCGTLTGAPRRAAKRKTPSPEGVARLVYA